MRRDPLSRNPNVASNQLDRVRRDVQAASEEDVRIEGDRRLILRSPNGTFFSVTVNDAGALSTTSLGATL